MAFQVKLPEGQSPAAFEMLAQHCHNSSPQFMTDANAKDVNMTVKVIGKGWEKSAGYSNVLRALAQQSRHSGRLLGADDDAQKQVAEWLEFHDADDGALTDAKLKQLDDHLKTRNYLVGSDLTLADFAVFAAVHAAVSGFSDEQVAQHVNLVRWFDHIQHTADTTSTHSKVCVMKPAFRMPPQLAPAPAKKDAGKGKETGGGDKKTSGGDKKTAVDSGRNTAASASGAEAPATPAQSDAAAAPAPAVSAAGKTADSGDQVGKTEKRAKKEKKPPPPQPVRAAAEEKSNTL